MASKLAQMQARFQQKQMQEKEEKLVRLYESQQQRVFERVGRGSAGSNTSISSTTSSSTVGGKVRQMFDERRQKAGIDRSYPLEPLKQAKVNGQVRVNSIDRNRNVKPAPSATTTITRTTIKATVKKDESTTMRNGNAKPMVMKREVIQSVYNNNAGHETAYQKDVFVDDRLDERDLVDMMNNHNLYDNLDDEELPSFGIDDLEEPAVRSKPTNLGGKPPSQQINELKTVIARTKQSPPNSKTSPMTSPKTSPSKVKPIIRRTVVKGRTTQEDLGQYLNQQDSNPSSPTEVMHQQSGRSKLTSAQPANSGRGRAPSAGRPSQRQTGKSNVVRDDLESCKYCTRRFASDRLQVHEDICARTAKKKRKTYDATRHRLQGTELEPYVRKFGKPSPKNLAAREGVVSKKQGSAIKPAQKKTEWRRKHEEFIAAIRAAKMAQAHVAKGGKLSDLPPPPPSTNPDYVQCPHCGRRFNEAAAARHIPKCASYDFNKPKNTSSTKALPKGSAGGRPAVGPTRR